MVRMESDAGLRQALVQAAMARQAGEDVVVEMAAPQTPAAKEGAAAASAQTPVPDQIPAPAPAGYSMASANVDPGATAEIRLNLPDDE